MTRQAVSSPERAAVVAVVVTVMLLGSACAKRQGPSDRLANASYNADGLATIFAAPPAPTPLPDNVRREPSGTARFGGRALVPTEAQTGARKALIDQLDRSGISAILDERGVFILIPHSAYVALGDNAPSPLPEAAGVHFADEFDIAPVPPGLRTILRSFPQDQRRASVTDSLGEVGTIVLREGCFFVRRIGKSDALAVFPADLGLVNDSQGFLGFHYRYKKKPMTLPRVGSPAALGRVQQIAGFSGLREECGNYPIVAVGAVALPLS